MQTDEEVLLPAPLSEQAALNPYVLGATPNDDGVDFVVNAPGASAVDLCLIDGEGADLHERLIGMHDHLTAPGQPTLAASVPASATATAFTGPGTPTRACVTTPASSY